MTNRNNLQSGKSSIQAFNNNPSSKSKPIPKQFQLLYHEKDGSNSNQAYESVIFVKTKKCSNPSPNIDKSIKSNKKNQSQLKNIIRSTQKEIKMKQIKQSNLSKMNRNKQRSCHLKKVKGHAMKQLSHQTILAEKKQKLQKRKKQKFPQIQNSKFSCTNFKESMKTKSVDRKIEHQSLTNNYQISLPKKSIQYLLFKGKFIPVQQISVNRLQTKLFQTFRHNNYKNTRQFQQNLAMNQYAKFFTDNGQDNQNGKQSAQQSIQAVKMRDLKENKQKKQDENHIMESMKMLQKVMLIQRWWKNIFKNKKIKQTLKNQIYESGNQQIYGINAKQSQQDNEIKYYKDQKNALKKQMLIKPPVLQCINNINQTSNIYKKQRRMNNQQNIIQLRQHAILLQKQTHIKILKKLLESHKITEQIHSEKLQLVEKNYLKELHQLLTIKKLLDKNAQDFEKLVNKTKEDIIIAENKEITDEDIEHIFGPKIILMQNKEQKLGQTREKSSGCHYSSTKQTAPSSIHQRFFKQQVQPDDETEQSFPQQRDHHIDEDQQNQFYQGMGNIYPEFISNNNFRQLLEEYKQRQDLKIHAEQRIAFQLGLVPPKNEQNSQKNNLNTSIAAIHHFLNMFFKFYIYYYKEDFLRLMNMPYGFNPQRRLAYMQKYQDLLPEVDQQGIIYGLDNIISEEILEDFHENYYQEKIQLQKQDLYFQKVHNKALFDAFNQGLNHFRPYFNINGPPYSWNYSEKALTFFFIAEENIKEVFEKTQYRILKWASSLCGIMLDQNQTKNQNEKIDTTEEEKQMTLQQILLSYRQKSSPVIIQIREQRLYKAEKADIQEQSYQWFLHEEQKTALLYEISILILDDLGRQIVQQFNQNSQIKQNLVPFQEQYCGQQLQQLKIIEKDKYLKRLNF